jgi:hypothetical protein
MAVKRFSVSPSPHPDVAALPPQVSRRRVRRDLLRLSAIAVVAVVVVALLPGLDGIRNRFAHAAPAWIVVGCALELASAMCYILAFRGVFCTRMTWATSYKIAMSEQGASSVFPLGGAGGLALGVWGAAARRDARCRDRT